MREQALCSVLLVKAIEEADRTGALITAAERTAASKEARRDNAAPVDVGVGNGGALNGGAPNGGARNGSPLSSSALNGSAQRMLAQRAAILESRLVERYPFIAAVRGSAGGPRMIAFLVIGFALLIGLALSTLDGTTRINLLAPGLIGLVLWNLVVYAWLLWRALRYRRAGKARPFARLLAHNATATMLKLISRSASFNAPLAEALRQFSREWIDAARPLLLARATRVIHVGAAAIGVGLIGGLYARGIAFDYMAGWESTFLDATRARSLFHVLYGPAAALLQIPLPDVAQTEALRWTGSGGGEHARKWMLLLMATVGIYVVAPRLLLALLSSAAITRWSMRMPLPPSLPAYFRNVFGAVDSSIGRGIVMVAPYAHAVSSDAVLRLREILPAAFGPDLAVDLREPVAYGGEEEFIRHLADRGGAIADVVVLLFNLAATPEEENHGTLIASVREWLASHRRNAQLLVLLDSGPYAERMGSDSRRIAERQRAWERFVADRGLSTCTVDLASPASDSEATVTALRKALWQPS